MAWYIPGVPRYFAKKITDEIGRQYNVDIKVDYLFFVPPRSLTFKHILLKEPKGDTLIYVPKLTVSLADFSWSEKKVKIGRVGVYNAFVGFKTDSLGSNFQSLLDSISKSNPSDTSVNWQFSVNSVKLRECRFKYDDATKPDTVLRFNPAHFDLTNLNLVVDSILQQKDSLDIKVQQLSFKDKCGFMVSRLRSHVKVGNSGVVLENVWASTLYSSFEADSLVMRYKSAKDFADFYTKIQLGASLKQVFLDPKDLHLLTPLFPGLHERFALSGVVEGKVSNLKGRDVKLSYGNNTSVEADFDINGLPRLSETFLYLDIVNLQSDIEDLQRLLGKDSITPLILPPNFKKLGTLSYKGNFTGFFNDLVAYGVFSTGLGEITTDMGFKLKEDNSIFYSGTFRTKRFNVGEIIGQSDNLNRISLNLTVNGGWSPSGNYLAYLEGNVDSIQYNQYKYHRLNLKGLFTQRQFDGEFEVDDPNGYLNFNGRVDFSSSIPSFNFVSLVKDVHLDKLNLVPYLKNSNLSLKVESNLSGSSLDDLEGEVKIVNASLLNERNDIKIPNFLLKTSNLEGKKQIVCNSSVLDAELSGNFQFSELSNIFLRYLNNYFPSLYPEAKTASIRKNSNLAVRLNTKRISPIVDVFWPEYQVADTMLISGALDASTNDANLVMEMDGFKTPMGSVDKFYLRYKSNGSKALWNSKVKTFKVGESMTFENLSINNQAYNDTLFTNVFWNNWGDKVNSGSFYTNTTFKPNAENGIDLFLNLLPSSLVFENSEWKVAKSYISFQSQGVEIQNFEASHNDQVVFANGTVLKGGDDELTLNFNNFNMEYFTGLFDLSAVTFGGKLQGDVKLYNLYSKPYFTSELSVSDFLFNKSYQGLLVVNSKWNTDKEVIDLNARLTNSGSTAVNASGFVSPKENKVDIDVDLDHFNIGFLNNYLDHIMQRMKGSVSGHLKVDGPLDAPGLTGKVRANNIEFDVDLMNTHYSVNDTAIFTPHEMYFDNMVVRDVYGNQGTFTGSIFHTLFDNFAYDLHVKCKNMLVLNTKASDNPLYYGTIYANGGMDIEGDMNDFNMSIFGKTLPKTTFYIPLQESDEAEATRFIRFTTAPKEGKKGKDDYQVNVSGMSMTLNAEITPDALTQIIFNSKSGDILESKGNGNIQVKIDKDGKISFYGNYTILDGDYLFTLQNLVNKKFKINEGGTVRWTGDPYNANIDIKATYKLRASLSDLYGSSYSDVNSGGSRRIPIDCNLLLSDNLQQPTIKFDIETPSLENQNRNLIKEYIATEEEMNNQVISLLVLNRFYTPQYLQVVESGSANSQEKNALLTTSTELLTGQLSLWLSQISKDVDVGVSYRPGDEITNEEMALSLSTQLFNNRVTLNGTTGYSKGVTNTSGMIGDFDVDVKLNPSGTLSWKAYTKTNDNLIYDNSPTTQGTGITYKEEFNSFVDVLRKYWAILFSKEEGDEKVEKK